MSGEAAGADQFAQTWVNGTLGQRLSLAFGPGEHLRVPDQLVSGCTAILRRLRAELPEFRSVGVVSALPGEGRSTLAAGLATAWATAEGQPTALLDLSDSNPASGDPTQPTGATPGSGDPLQQLDWVLPGLALLRTRSWLPPGTTVTRGSVSQLLGALEARRLAAVADLPAMPPYGSADQLAEAFDVVVLVVRAGSTPLDAVTMAADALPGRPAVVLNRTRSAVPRWLTHGADR